MGITCDQQGNIYIADSGNARIVKLSSNGTLLQLYHSNNTNTSMFYPTNIVIYDTDGSIIFSDPPNSRLVHLPSSGVFVRNYTLSPPDFPLFRRLS